MRKLLLLLLTIVGCLQVHAQRYADLSITLNAPHPNYVAYWNKPFLIDADIKNIGEDTVRFDDTLAFALIFDGNVISFGSPGSTKPYLELTGTILAPGGSTNIAFNFGVNTGWDTGSTEMCVMAYNVNTVDTLHDTVMTNNESCNTFFIYSGVSVGNLAANLSDVKVYPNPANGIANFDVKLNTSASVEMCITDITGKLLIRHIEQTMVGKSQQIPIDISMLSSGMYLYSVTAGQEKMTGRLQVQ